MPLTQLPRMLTSHFTLAYLSQPGDKIGTLPLTKPHNLFKVHYVFLDLYLVLDSIQDTLHSVIFCCFCPLLCDSYLVLGF